MSAPTREHPAHASYTYRTVRGRSVRVFFVGCWLCPDWRPLDPHGYTFDEREAVALAESHRKDSTR
jgi:hypothetical protein